MLLGPRAVGARDLNFVEAGRIYLRSSVCNPLWVPEGLILAMVGNWARGQILQSVFVVTASLTGL